MLKEGTRAEIDGTPPVKEGEEVRLKIAEPHQFNLSDGVARVGGYPVVVGGGISYVGQEHKVRIERAGRTTAYATLLDAKPKALEIPQDPAEFEIPEFDREVGERLELEDRSRNRRGRTARTPKKAGGGEAGGVPVEGEADAPARPRRSPWRRRPTPRRRPRARRPLRPSRKRRRGTRGGRGRTKKPADRGDVGQRRRAPRRRPSPRRREDKPAPKPRRRRAPAKPKAGCRGAGAAEVPASAERRRAGGQAQAAPPHPRRPKPKDGAPPPPRRRPLPPAPRSPKRAGGLFSRLLGRVTAGSDLCASAQGGPDAAGRPVLLFFCRPHPRASFCAGVRSCTR